MAVDAPEQVAHSPEVLVPRRSRDRRAFERLVVGS